MTDPTFDPAGGDYASGRVTLHKTRGPALAASQVGPVDVVLLSHDQHAVVLLFGGGAQVRGPFYSVGARMMYLRRVGLIRPRAADNDDHTAVGCSYGGWRCDTT